MFSTASDDPMRKSNPHSRTGRVTMLKIFIGDSMKSSNDPMPESNQHYDASQSH